MHLNHNTRNMVNTEVMRNHTMVRADTVMKDTMMKMIMNTQSMAKSMETMTMITTHITIINQV